MLHVYGIEELTESTGEIIEIAIGPDQTHTAADALKWSDYDLQNSFQLNADFSTINPGGDYYNNYTPLDVGDCLTCLRSAYGVWAQKSFYKYVKFYETTSHSNIIPVIWSTNTNIMDPEDGGGVSLLVDYNNQEQFCIYSNDPYAGATPGILLNVGTDRGFYWSTLKEYPANKSNYIYLYNVLLHEFGHFLGLSHNMDDATSVMYNSLDRGIVDGNGWFKLREFNSYDQSCYNWLLWGTIVGLNDPPHAPTNFSIDINGTNAVLSWASYSGQANGLKVYKNDQYLTSLIFNQTSYTDINAVSTTPCSYKIGAFNMNGTNFSPSINLIISPSIINVSTAWNGVIFINTSVVINSGVNLTIDPKTKVIFNSGNNLNLTVNGGIQCCGQSDGGITFKTNSSSPYPGSWGNITISGSGANNSIMQYSAIQYGAEIDVFNANNVKIQNCNITNSSMHGINFSGGTSCTATNNTISNTNTAHGILIQTGAVVTCSGNVITRTNTNKQGVGIYFGGGGTGIATQNEISGFDWGIGATWGSSPTSYSGQSGLKNNHITNCYTGIEVCNASYPVFGTITPNDQYGSNSIYDNTYNAYVYNTSSYTSSLSGQDDWWGSAPPNASKFYVGSGASIYYNGYLFSNPWDDNQQGQSFQGGSSVDNIEYKTANIQNINNNLNGSSNNLDSLIIGIKLKDSHKVKDAKEFFLSYLKKHPDNQAAYNYLYNCADSSNTPEIITFFNSFPSQAAKEQKLLLSYLNLRQGNISLAKDINSGIIKDNPNTPLGVRAKLNNFYIVLYDDKDIKTATSLLNDVKTQADLSTPMEIVTAEDALSVFSSVISANTVSPLLKQNANEEIEKPTTYSLSQNFPNPFNPSTIIIYQIPKAGLVTIKVYDILGKEVATIVNEYKGQGYFNVTFDASKIPSGVYIYQLRSNDFVSSKKMVLIK